MVFFKVISFHVAPNSLEITTVSSIFIPVKEEKHSNSENLEDLRKVQKQNYGMIAIVSLKPFSSNLNSKLNLLSKTFLFFYLDQRCTQHLKSEGVWGRKFFMTTPSKRLENEGNALFSYPLHFMHVMVQTFQIVLMRLFQRWQRNPYSQRHVQAEITRDIEMIGSVGKTPEKCLKVCIQLRLRMPLPAVFKHFLKTKTLLPTLEKHSLLPFQESQRPLLDRSARPPRPPPILLHFSANHEDQLFEKCEDQHSPLGYATDLDHSIYFLTFSPSIFNTVYLLSHAVLLKVFFHCRLKAGSYTLSLVDSSLVK